MLANSSWSMVNDFQKDLLSLSVAMEDANEAAQVCRLNTLATIKGFIEDLERIKQIAWLVAYVARIPTVTQPPAIVKGASELLEEIFGENGKQARSAVDMAVFH